MGRFNLNKVVVIKIGTSSLVNTEKQIDINVIQEIANQVSLIQSYGKQVLIVTSGAITVGANKLKLQAKTVPLKQACAAVGQASLINTYESIFENRGLKVAQILVSHDDFDNRDRMLNLRNTLETLLENEVVPVINENDALSTNEIKVGDNDTLAALIAATCHADLVLLLSDIDGLYDSNPKINHEAKLIPVVETITDEIVSMATGSVSGVGTGGMNTKIKAAKIATSAGCDLMIVNSTQLSEINELFLEKKLGTLFKKSSRMSSRGHWLLYTTNPKGAIVLDKGAVEALVKNRKSLLAKGIKEIVGVFPNNSVVQIENEKQEVIAKGIVNYSSDDIKAIKGKNSSEIEEILGHKKKDEIIHANDIVIIGGENNA